MALPTRPSTHMQPQRDPCVAGQTSPDPLIVAARQGSVEALDALIERLSEQLWAEMTGRRRRLSAGLSHGSSDLVQDTLLRVRQQFDKFERDTFADFRQWARSVLYRRRLEWMRNHRARNNDRHKRMLWSLLQVRTNMSANGEAPHETAIEQKQEAERVYRHFQSLKPNEQFIIDLRLVNSLTYKQIGAMTGSSEDAARKSYDRAIAKLKAKSQQDGKP